MNYLSNKLARAIQKPPFGNSKRPSSTSPSTASAVVDDGRGGTKVVGACHRQQYYRMTGQAPDEIVGKNIDWTLSAMIGDKLHELLVQIIDSYGFSMGIQRLAREHSIYSNITGLSGRSDLIVWDYNINEPVGIEIKSVGEYKAKKVMEQPSEEHVLQSVVYLDYYNSHIPDDQKKIKKWYIWYISRTENWSVKSKSHNSDFTMLWDYTIELEDNVPVITLGDGNKQKWIDYSIEKIYKRYTILKEAVEKKQIPPRDYEILYSEEKVVGLFKTDQLTRKTDKDIIEKWLAKGAKAGKLKIEMGDIECTFCEYKKLCYEGVSNENSMKEFSNLPTSNEDKKEPKATKESFFL